ncbi:FAD binding domain-containing protein [Pholiota molesta]|nr:FAD binding domain-containing protein [Pholiota molesta]
MSTASKQLPVLVVGAGPTGLTTALYLVQNGINVRIIEQSVQLHAGIRGTAILPRTQELLAILGAENDLFKIDTGPLQMAVYGPDGKTILKAFDWSEQAEESPAIPFRKTASVSQAQLEIILRQHLQEYGCEVEMGMRLNGISQDDSKATATVEVVQSKKEVLIDCSYIVAADGAKGRSRHLIGVSFLGETKEADRMWTANVEVPGFSREYWHRWGDFAKAATSLKPIYPAPLFHMQSLGGSLPKDIPMDLAGTQQLFNSITGRDDVKLETAEYMSEWKANIRMSDKFSVGRVFLAGDVAHCHSPTGGQGTNTAMQDALNLAWKLALVVNGKASYALLKSYEAERMPVVAEMLNLSNALHARAFPHIPATAFETPEANNTQPDPMQRSRKLLQLGINYRWSNIIYDERNDKEAIQDATPYDLLENQIRAGDRAPYIGGLTGGSGETTNLFSLLRDAPSHLVLIFPSSGSSPIEQLSAIQSIIDAGLIQFVVILGNKSSDKQTPDKGVRYLVDSQDTSRASYHIDANRSTYVTIRPDGIIGAFTFGVNGIKEYFVRVGVTV